MVHERFREDAQLGDVVGVQTHPVLHNDVVLHHVCCAKPSFPLHDAHGM
jgi:hypothetical protein